MSKIRCGFTGIAMLTPYQQFKAHTDIANADATDFNDFVVPIMMRMQQAYNAIRLMWQSHYDVSGNVDVVFDRSLKTFEYFENVISDFIFVRHRELEEQVELRHELLLDDMEYLEYLADTDWTQVETEANVIRLARERARVLKDRTELLNRPRAVGHMSLQGTSEGSENAPPPPPE